VYSEVDDFNEKKAAMLAMDQRLDAAGMRVDFSSARALEIGGAGGIFGGLMAQRMKNVIVTDIVHHQAVYGGEFSKLLAEKFSRNGQTLPLSKIEFQYADAMELPFRDNWFDFLFSLNAFEHIPDPIAALTEAVRVTKPGGLIYLSFDPVWTADTGNHFSEYVRDPWQHLLKSTEAFCEEMKANGANLEQINDFVRGLNRKPASTYEVDIPAKLSKLGVFEFKKSSWSGCVNPASEKHENLNLAASVLGCKSSDLLIRGFSFCIKKS